MVMVKVIETNMSMYAMHVYRHAKFECHSLNIVRDITIISIKYYTIDLVQVALDLYIQDNAEMAVIGIEPGSPTSKAMRWPCAVDGAITSISLQ